MENNKSRLLILGGIVLTAAGFGAGWYGAGKWAKKGPEKKPPQIQKDKMIETRGGGYRYINPLWECDNFSPSQLNSIVQLRSDVSAYVDNVLKEKKAVHVSVYFRDLNSGPWLGINEREKFSPASLLKVPILIAALKKAEKDPSYLQKQLTYNNPLYTDVTANIRDTSLVSGRSYTIEDLLMRMIAYSDNDAKDLVLEDLGGQLLVDVMKDIGIDISGVTVEEDFITVKDYSSFFRLLYNATYLSKDMSEKGLEILSKTSYGQGLVAGIPKGIVVSHKFGERAFETTHIRQLHDCGIVYRAGSPYVLCVMTRGTDFNQLAAIIAGVSEIVYKTTIVEN